MPVKLLSNLRLLNPPLPVTRFPTMNFKLSPNSTRAVPALHRIFPFKLKYLGFSTRVNSQQQHQLGVRKLSTRPFRPVASSEFDRRRRRGGGGEVRSSKSLIEDEAELDSWVSDLGSDPFHSNKGFRKHDDVSDFRKGRGSETRGGGDRDRDSSSMKRRRESESDYESNSRGNRNSVNTFSRNNNNNNNSRFNRRPNSQLQDGNRENYSRKGNYRFERGNASSFTGRRNEMKGNNLKKTRFLDDGDNDDDEEDDVGEERGRIMSGIRDLLSDEVSDVDDDDDDIFLRNNARSSIGLDKENCEKSVARSSPGKYDSFMSESRYIFK